MIQSDTTAYIGLGSNLGDRAGNLLLAVRGLVAAGFRVERLSSIYETEPVGLETDLKFLNMVAEVCISNYTPSQVMTRLLRIEFLLGRGDKTVKKPRTVDLDILLFGDERLVSDFLTLPHPRMHERRFVLTPLAEIAPTLVHPILKKDMINLLTFLDDDSEVRLWDPRPPVDESNLGVHTLSAA